MAELRRLEINIQANTGTTKQQIDSINKSTDSLNKTLGQTSSAMNNVGKQSSVLGSSFKSMLGAFVGGDLIVTGMKRIGQAMLNMGKDAVMAAANIESQRQGFKTLLGSIELADEAIKMIQEDAKKTPFTFTGLLEANKALTFVTKNAQVSEKVLLDVGKALAAAGKGQAELDRVIFNLQQIGNTGKITEMDIRQFGNAGINILELLADSYGVTKAEASEMVKDSKNGFLDLAKAFDKAGSEGGRFANSFTDQAGTMNQLISNLGDSWEVFLAGLGEKTFPILKPIISALTDFVSNDLQGWINGILGVLSKLVSVLQVLWPLIKTVGTAWLSWLVVTKVANAVSSLNLALQGFQIVGPGIISKLSGITSQFALMGGGAGSIINTITGALELLGGVGTKVVTALGPVGLIIAGIVTTIGLLYTAWQNNFGGMKDSLAGTLAEIKPVWDKFIQALTFALYVFKAVWDRVVAGLKAIWDSTLKGLVQAFTTIINGVVKQFQGFIEILKGNWGKGLLLLLEGAINIWKGILKAVWTVIKAIGQIIWAFVKNAGKLFYDLLLVNLGILKDLALNWRTILTNILLMIRNWAKGVFQRVASIDWVSALKGIGSAVGKWLSESLKAVVNWAKNVWKRIKDALSGKEGGGDVGVFTVNVAPEVNEQAKKGFIEDLNDGINKINWANTTAALRKLGEDFGDIILDAGLDMQLEQIKKTAEVQDEINDKKEEQINLDEQLASLASGATDDAKGASKAENESVKARKAKLELDLEIAKTAEEKIDLLKKEQALYKAGSAEFYDIEKKILDIKKESQKLSLEEAEKVFKKNVDNLKVISEYRDKLAKTSYKDTFTIISSTGTNQVKENIALQEKLKKTLADQKVDIKDLIGVWETGYKDVDEALTKLESDHKAKLDSINKSLNEVASNLEKASADYLSKRTESTGQFATDVANAVVSAERKIKELRADLDREENIKRRNEIQNEINKEQKIIDGKQKAQQEYLKWVETVITDSENRLKAIKEKIASATDDEQRISLLQEQALIEETLKNQAQLRNKIDTEINKARIKADATDLERIIIEFQERMKVEQEQFEQQKAQLLIRQTELEAIKQREINLYAQKKSEIEAFETEITNIFMANLTAREQAEMASINRLSQAYEELAKQRAEAGISLGRNISGAPAGFYSGGFTGRGSLSDIAGVVHKGEFVLPAWMVNRFSGLVKELERVRVRGFAQGGYTSSMPSQTTYNQPININARVESEMDFHNIGRYLAWALRS